MRQLNSLIIKKPWISEKAVDMSALGKYVFLVDGKAKSHQIREAIEAIYKVHVVKVNIVRINNSDKNIKKAILTLKKGETIDTISH